MAFDKNIKFVSTFHQFEVLLMWSMWSMIEIYMLIPVNF